MKTITRISIAFAILTACAFAQAPTMPQFSADMSMTSQRQPEPTKGKIFFDKGNMRMDMTTQRGDVSIIRDNSAKVSYTLMHERKMYMEMKDGAQQRMGRMMRPPDVRAYDPSNPCAGEEGVTCKKIGDETVNGRDCEKWEFTSTDASKNKTAWVDKKLHFPVKTVSAESTFELSNIKEGAQDKSHFEVPADYQKFDPAMMMGGQGRGPGL
jgi:outer membrane lipoprotein-sorting protein